LLSLSLSRGCSLLAAVASCVLHAASCSSGSTPATATAPVKGASGFQSKKSSPLAARVVGELELQ
jgi:hypothetical protein